jgi:RHS repeat-associated protein
LASISGASQFVDNQIVSNAHSTFQSDADGFGNLSSEILNDSAHFTRNYTYRTDGKLTQMDVVFDREWRCDPQVTQVVTQTQYSYDALGRRAAKLTTFKPNLGHGMGPAMGYTQSFSYLGNQDKILLAKSGDGITSLYLDGQGIDEHLGKVSKRGTQPYFTDHLGSVLNTAIAGGLQSYDSYGRTIAGFPLFAEVLSSDPVNYGFAGRQFDIESEKYYNRARMYDPATGRFLNQDPLGLKGGLNLYRYAKNNPLSYVDPYGRSPLGCMLGGALLGVSVVYGGAFIYGAYTGGTYLAGYLAADSAINGSAGLWGLYVGAAAGLGWSIPSASSDPTYSLGDFDYGYGGDDEDSSTFNFGGFLNQAPGSPSLGVNTDIGSSDFSSDSSSGDGS